MDTHPNRTEQTSTQESVWDYPTPPRVEPADRRIRVVFAGVTLADTVRAWRVLETGHPPVYFIPPEDVLVEHLVRTEQQSVCEFKGVAIHYAAIVGDREAPMAAWCYPDPTPDYSAIARHLAFHPGPMDECLVDADRALPMPDDDLGGWITPNIAGPFKGEPDRDDG